jgi:acyl-[acyl-carrier-protein] desaturase
MPELTDTTRLLHELEPVVAANLERHLGAAKEWMPHDYVPWSQGRDFALLGGDEWEAEQSSLSPIARTALEVNLLTEDNLPSYHREIERAFGRDGAWGTWVHRWTAEEGRHAICLRDYLVVTRGIDPVELERSRMEVMQRGFETDEKPFRQVMAYVSFQELATRISHRNTGRYTQDSIAERLLQRVATDENLHMVFYRNLVTEALTHDPDGMVRAITDEVVGFEMPGSIIPSFARKSMLIAKAGIYDLRIHHDEVVQPLLRHWGIFELEGLGTEGEKARQELADFLVGLDAQASRYEEQRAAAEAKAVARGKAPAQMLSSSSS